MPKIKGAFYFNGLGYPLDIIKLPFSEYVNFSSFKDTGTGYEVIKTYNKISFEYSVPNSEYGYVLYFGSERIDAIAESWAVDEARKIIFEEEQEISTELATYLSAKTVSYYNTGIDSGTIKFDDSVSDFNVGANTKAARKLLMTYVDVSPVSGQRKWEIVGRGVEDSTIELNPTSERKTDVLGITENDVTAWEPNQSFDPNTVRGGSDLNFKLHRIWQEKKPELLSKFDVMIVYAYIGKNVFDAEIHQNCTINITSIGGSAYVDMPIEISYSNDVLKGHVTMNGKTPVFTQG